MDVADAAQFALSTVKGYILDDNELLAAYGLGSLLPNWELNFVVNEGYQIKGNQQSIYLSILYKYYTMDRYLFLLSFHSIPLYFYFSRWEQYHE